jgi:hypothetical protein
MAEHKKEKFPCPSLRCRHSKPGIQEQSSVPGTQTLLMHSSLLPGVGATGAAVGNVAVGDGADGTGVVATVGAPVATDGGSASGEPVGAVVEGPPEGSPEGRTDWAWIETMEIATKPSSKKYLFIVFYFVLLDAFMKWE